jgi:hypothetical protein
MFGFTYPVAQYDHDLNGGGPVAIAGGIVYRGAFHTPLNGTFVFGDLVSGRLFYADVDELVAAADGDPATTAQIYDLGLLRNGQPTTLLDLVIAEVGSRSRTDLRFAADLAGNLYVTTKQDGFIRRLAPTAEPVPALSAPHLLVAAALLLSTGMIWMKRSRRQRWQWS